jgi:hypothetical protein
MSKKHQKVKEQNISNTAVPKSSYVQIQKSPIDWSWIGFGVIIFLVGLIRWRLLSMPLERDEGEYAYMGKLILEGIPPYKEAYNMKLPGTYFMYALWMAIFGKTITGVHLGLLCTNWLTLLGIFISFKKLFNANVALFSAAIFGLMSVSPNLLGFAGHATHFVTLFAVWGLYFYAQNKIKNNFLFYFLSGLMFGFSFLMKQQALFFIIFGGFIFIVHFIVTKSNAIGKLLVNLLAYSLGVFLPYLITIYLMYATGVFKNFWFWTFEYASKYASGVSFEEGKMLFGMSFKPMWEEFMLVWILALIGIILVIVSKRWTIEQKILSLGIFIFSFLTVCPGFYFRQHYFVPFLIGVGLVSAIAVDTLSNYFKSKLNLNLKVFLPVTLLVIISFIALSKGKVYYFKTKTSQLSRMIYGTNPFIESVEIARFIKENSSKEDKIAILGSEPQIFLYADRNSATGYIYTYGLMEIHDYNLKMHQEMIAEIEKAKPEFLVFCRVNTSWLARPGSPTLIFDWFGKYAQENYDLVGVADIIAQNQTNYLWNQDARNYQPQSQDYLLVYKKKKTT